MQKITRTTFAVAMVLSFIFIISITGEVFAADSSNTVAKGIMYVGSDDGNSNGNIIALDAENGMFLWSTHTMGVDLSPTVVKDVVYVDTDAGFIYALDATTGEILWMTDLNSL